MTRSSRQQWLEAWNPDKVNGIARKTEDECYLADTPTMLELDVQFGSRTSEEWLVCQLTRLNETSGTKRKMDESKLEWTATVLSVNGRHVKASEMLLFFYKLRSQQYGQFYGSVDPDMIIRSFSTFMEQRMDAYARHEQEAYWKKLEEERKHAVSHADAINTEEYRRGYEDAEKRQ